GGSTRNIWDTPFGSTAGQPSRPCTVCGPTEKDAFLVTSNSLHSWPSFKPSVKEAADGKGFSQAWDRGINRSHLMRGATIVPRILAVTLLGASLIVGCSRNANAPVVAPLAKEPPSTPSPAPAGPAATPNAVASAPAGLPD